MTQAEFDVLSERAEDALIHAAECLIAMGDKVISAPKWLEESAGLLERLVEQAKLSPAQLPLPALVGQIRVRLHTVESLMASASSFYCGWLSTPPRMATTYSSEGFVSPSAGCGSFKIDG